MWQDNLDMIRDTLNILDRGYYWLNGKTVPLKLSRSQQEAAEVYLPDDIQRICNTKFSKRRHQRGEDTSCR